MIKIGGIFENKNLTLYEFTSIEKKEGIEGELLNFFSKKKINFEYITESGLSGGNAVLSLCVAINETPIFDDILHSKHISKYSINVIKTEDVSIIGIYGPHFREKPLIAAKLFSVLSSIGIKILGISTSISSVCCIISAKKHAIARKAIEKAFVLP